jgi:hypothetical protein
MNFGHKEAAKMARFSSVSIFTMLKRFVTPTAQERVP